MSDVAEQEPAKADYTSDGAADTMVRTEEISFLLEYFRDADADAESTGRAYCMK